LTTHSAETGSYNLACCQRVKPSPKRKLDTDVNPLKSFLVVDAGACIVLRRPDPHHQLQHVIGARMRRAYARLSLGQQFHRMIEDEGGEATKPNRPSSAKSGQRFQLPQKRDPTRVQLVPNYVHRLAAVNPRSDCAAET
jgi:hypothetical protein